MHCYTIACTVLIVIVPAFDVDKSVIHPEFRTQRNGSFAFHQKFICWKKSRCQKKKSKEISFLLCCGGCLSVSLSRWRWTIPRPFLHYYHFSSLYHPTHNYLSSPSIPPNTTMPIVSQSTSMPSKPGGDDVPTTEAAQQNHVGMMPPQSFGGDVSQSPPIPIVVPQKTVNPKFADTVVRTH